MPERVHLQAAAARGIQRAKDRLRGPEFPEPLRYLYDWFHELLAGRGVDMNGLMPLSFTELDAWARQTRRRPEPHEVRALFLLDAATRHPESGAH